MSAILQDAISEALGAFENQRVDVREDDREWSGILRRAIEGNDQALGGSVVRVLFDQPSTGEATAVLQFTGAGTSAASFGRPGHDPNACDALVVLGIGTDGPRRVVVARAGELPEPESPSDPVATEETRRRVESTVSIFVNVWRGREAVGRDERGETVREFSGRLRSIHASPFGWSIGVGQEEIEVLWDGTEISANATRSGDTGTLTIHCDRGTVTLRVVETEAEDDSDTSG